MIDRESLRAALAAHPRIDLPALPGRRNDVWTGVLVPIVLAPEPVAVATLRSRELREHAGEVCFPGGRREAGDADLTATALREAHEELTIGRCDILGALSSVPLYTSEYRLQPYVAAVEGSLAARTAEVARVLSVPIAPLFERAHLEAIPWSHGDLSGLSPMFELDGALMFGATAHAFYELLIVVAPLFGRELPPLRPGRYQWSDVLGKGA